MPKLQGFSWHIGYGSTKNPTRRNRSRCIYHSKPDMCSYKQSYRICNGSSNCQMYAESFKTVDNNTMSSTMKNTFDKEIYSYGKKKIKKDTPSKPKTKKKPAIIEHCYYGKMKFLKQTNKTITFATPSKQEVVFKKTIYDELIKLGTIKILTYN